VIYNILQPTCELINLFQQTDWQTAHDSCCSLGMKLASLDTFEQTQALKMIIQPHGELCQMIIFHKMKTYILQYRFWNHFGLAGHTSIAITNLNGAHQELNFTETTLGGEIK
jgi:hypothetical protein